MKINLKPARIGRDLLGAQLLPSGVFGWLEILAGQFDSDGELFALAGSLGAMAALLGDAFRASGSRVRDLTWALHRLVNRPGEMGDPIAGLENFEPWLRTFLLSPADSGPTRRQAIFQWIEVANERLTMKSYSRSDHRARHARILIAVPLALVVENSVTPSGAIQHLAELLLSFHDHLESAREAELGRNRIEPPKPDGLGGFYGMAEAASSPDEATIKESLERLSSEYAAFDSEGLSSPLRKVGQAIAREARSAIETRLASGQWPDEFRPAKFKHTRSSFWRNFWRKFGL